MEAKKILFLIHMPPPVHGASLMGEYIKNSRLINSKYTCNYINLSTSDSVNEMGFSFSKFFIYLKQFIRILREKKRFKPDLIYWTPSSHGSSFFLRDFPLYLLMNKKNTKFVFHYHNKNIRNQKCCNSIYRKFLKNNNIILLGESLYPEFSKYVSNERKFICQNGIPDNGNLFIDKSLDKTNNIHILFLSNLIPSKGVLDLIDALVLLNKKNVPFECVIVGAETTELSAEKLNRVIVEKDLSTKVKYVGKKYDKEKESVFLDTDLFVLPTYYPNECFPLVLLEAMQYAIPCISTDEGAIPEIIEDGVSGRIVKKHDIEGLAKTILDLINNRELLNTMKTESRNRFIKYFSLDCFENRLDQILTTIINME